MLNHNGTKFASFFSSLAGQFSQHIWNSIPSFESCQKASAQAIGMLLAGEEKNILEIAASEGTFCILVNKFIKDVCWLPEVKTYSLDPNKDMKNYFDSINKSPNNKFLLLPFGDGFGEFPEYRPINKFDIITEFFGFQFIDNDRMSQYKDVSQALSAGGVFITTSKVFNSDPALYAKNEALKDDYKRKSFNQDEINKKAPSVLLDMGECMETIEATEMALKANFKSFKQFWYSGNFVGYIAANDEQGEAEIDFFIDQFSQYFDDSNQIK